MCKELLLLLWRCEIREQCRKKRIHVKICWRTRCIHRMTFKCSHDEIDTNRFVKTFTFWLLRFLRSRWKCHMFLCSRMRSNLHMLDLTYLFFKLDCLHISCAYFNSTVYVFLSRVYILLSHLLENVKRTTHTLSLSSK